MTLISTEPSDNLNNLSILLNVSISKTLLLINPSLDS